VRDLQAHRLAHHGDGDGFFWNPEVCATNAAEPGSHLEEARAGTLLSGDAMHLADLFAVRPEDIGAALQIIETN